MDEGLTSVAKLQNMTQIDSKASDSILIQLGICGLESVNF